MGSKLWRSFLISAVPAMLLALAGWTEHLPAELDWGTWGPAVGALAPFIANVLRLLAKSLKT